MTEGGHRYFFGSHPEMPWRNKMSGARLLKMFNAIMQDVDKGNVDWQDVEDFREALVNVDEEITSLRETLDETTDALADCEANSEMEDELDEFDD